MLKTELRDSARQSERGKKEAGEEGGRRQRKKGEGRHSIAALAQWMSSSRGSGGGSISTTRCSISLRGCCGGRDLHTHRYPDGGTSLAFAHTCGHQRGGVRRRGSGERGRRGGVGLGGGGTEETGTAGGIAQKSGGLEQR